MSNTALPLALALGNKPIGSGCAGSAFDVGTKWQNVSVLKRLTAIAGKNIQGLHTVGSMLLSAPIEIYQVSMQPRP